MKSNVRKLSFCAMLIALAFAFSKIKIFPMPLGGSVTFFSMFAIALPGYFLGLKYGLMSSIIYSLIKLTFGGYVYNMAQGIFDYILAYGVFGLTGLFCKNDKNSGFIFGYIMAVTLRCIFSCISGYIFFADYTPESWNPIIYTICYNASYIYAEAIITLIVFHIPYINKNFYKLKLFVNI